MLKATVSYTIIVLIVILYIKVNVFTFIVHVASVTYYYTVYMCVVLYFFIK